MWNNVRYLMRQEYSGMRSAFLFTMIFSCFYGWMTATLAAVYFEPGRDFSVFTTKVNAIILDVFFIMVVPTISFLIQRNLTAAYWKTDMYSKNLQYLKRYSIHVKEIAYSRMLRHILNILATLPIFFAILALAYNTSEREPISITAWISFSLLWIGFSLALGALYVYYENILNGKQYFQFTCIIMGAMIVIVILLNLVTGFTIFDFTLTLAMDARGFVSGLVWFGFSVLCTGIITKRLVINLQKRDF